MLTSQDVVTHTNQWGFRRDTEETGGRESRWTTPRTVTTNPTLIYYYSTVTTTGEILVGWGTRTKRGLLLMSRERGEDRGRVYRGQCQTDGRDYLWSSRL